MIVLKDIEKKFKNNERVVLNSINIELPDRGLVIFLGRSGSGKSTLLNVIGGLDDYKGMIDYGNGPQKYNMSEIDKYRQTHFSYIFQDFYLEDNETVFSNVKKGLLIKGISNPEECEKRIDESLRAVGLLRYRRRKAGQLSLGQRQRVAVARAISSKPDVLFADEPTGNLDSVNGEQIFEILKELSKEMLVLLVTHNEEMANKYNDILYRIEDGVLKEKTISNNIINKGVKHSNLTKKDANCIDFSKNGFKFKVYDLDNSSNKEVEITLLRRDGKTYIELPEGVIATKLEPSMFVTLENKEMENVQEISFDTSNFDETKKEKVKERLFFPKLNTSFKHKKFLTVISFILAFVFSFFFAFSYSWYNEYSSQWNRQEVYLCSNYGKGLTNALEFTNDNPGTFLSIGKRIELDFSSFSALENDFNTWSYNYLTSGQLVGIKDSFLTKDKDYKVDEVLISKKLYDTLRSFTTKEIIGSEFKVYKYNKQVSYKIVGYTDLISNEAILFPHEENVYGTYKFSGKNEKLYRYGVSLDIFDGIKLEKATYGNYLSISTSALEKSPLLLNYLNNSGAFVQYVFDHDDAILQVDDNLLSHICVSFETDMLSIDDAKNYDYEYTEINTDSTYDYPTFAFREDVYQVLNDYFTKFPFLVTKTYKCTDSAPIALAFYDEWNSVALSKAVDYSNSYYNYQYFYIDNNSYQGIEVVVPKNSDLSSFVLNNHSIIGSYEDLSGNADRLNYYLLIFIISVLLFAVMVLTYSLLFRSYYISQEKKIGVYRSLGMNRAPIFRHVALEISTTFGLYFSIPYVILAIVFASIGVPIWINLIVLLLVYGLVLFFSMLPILTLLSKTPHNIMVKHDI